MAKSPEVEGAGTLCNSCKAACPSASCWLFASFAEMASISVPVLAETDPGDAGDMLILPPLTRMIAMLHATEKE